MEYLTLLDPKLEGNNTIKYIIELLSPLIKLDQNNRFDKSKVSMLNLLKWIIVVWLYKKSISLLLGNAH